MFCSRPSGIKDFPVERSSSISERSRLSSTPSARRSLSVVAVSSASRPAKDLAASSGDCKRGEVRRHFAIGVDDVRKQGVGRAAGDAREVGANPVALALALVACLTVLGEDAGAAAWRRPGVEGSLIACQGLGALGRGKSGQNLGGTLALAWHPRDARASCGSDRQARRE